MENRNCVFSELLPSHAGRICPLCLQVLEGVLDEWGVDATIQVSSDPQRSEEVCSSLFTLTTTANSGDR